MFAPHTLGSVRVAVHYPPDLFPDHAPLSQQTTTAIDDDAHLTVLQHRPRSSRVSGVLHAHGLLEAFLRLLQLPLGHEAAGDALKHLQHSSADSAHRKEENVQIGCHRHDQGAKYKIKIK